MRQSLLRSFRTESGKPQAFTPEWPSGWPPRRLRGESPNSSPPLSAANRLNLWDTRLSSLTSSNPGEEWRQFVQQLNSSSTHGKSGARLTKDPAAREIKAHDAPLLGAWRIGQRASIRDILHKGMATNDRFRTLLRGAVRNRNTRDISRMVNRISPDMRKPLIG